MPQQVLPLTVAHHAEVVLEHVSVVRVRCVVYCTEWIIHAMRENGQGRRRKKAQTLRTVDAIFVGRFVEHKFSWVVV